MPPQLKVLVPLFAVFISIFLILRIFLVPDTFYEFGHYRGNSLADNANKEFVFSNKETCIECHPDIYEKQQSDLHAGLSCLICHGTGREHTESPEPSNILKKSGRDHCGRCHGNNPARSPNIITQINIEDHYSEKTNCIECHNPHQVWELTE